MQAQNTLDPTDPSAQCAEKENNKHNPKIKVISRRPPANIKDHSIPIVPPPEHILIETTLQYSILKGVTNKIEVHILTQIQPKTVVQNH